MVRPTGPSLDQVVISYPPTRIFSVFISHSEKDKELVEKLADYIKRCGQTPYIAESPDNPDLAGCVRLCSGVYKPKRGHKHGFAHKELGKKLWEEKINGGIQKSNVMQVLWTQNSSTSAVVRYEIERAKKIGKRIMPAIESSLDPPESLKELVYVRFNYYNQLQAVQTILRSLLNYESEIQGRQNANAIWGFLASCCYWEQQVVASAK